MKVTDEAALKSEPNPAALETIFSAEILPDTFFRDLLRGHSAVAMQLGFINHAFYFTAAFLVPFPEPTSFEFVFPFLRLDLASGGGTAAKACLQERIPYHGICLSETHAKKLEIRLTNWMESEIKREGSTHYRPEAIAGPEAMDDDNDEDAKTKEKKDKKRKKDDKDDNPKQKKEKKTKDQKAEDKPEKKNNKNKNEENDENQEDEEERSESMPW